MLIANMFQNIIIFSVANDVIEGGWRKMRLAHLSLCMYLSFYIIIHLAQENTNHISVHCK